MSEENNQVRDQVEQSSGADSETAKVVPKSAYEDVSKDMHKYKSKLREKEAYAAELEVRLNQIEESSLAEKQQYKELFEKRNAEFESLKHEVAEERNKYLRSVKRNALKNELGGKIKDEYLVHANLDSITFNEAGSVDPESLLNVANKFRETYPELIPASSSQNATGYAPPSNSTFSGQELKPLSKMSMEERKALLNSPEQMALYRSKGLI